MRKTICCGTCWQYHATCTQKGQNMTGKLWFSNHRKCNCRTEPPPRIWIKNWEQIKSSSICLNTLQPITSISIKRLLKGKYVTNSFDDEQHNASNITNSNKFITCLPFEILSSVLLLKKKNKIKFRQMLFSVNYNVLTAWKQTIHSRGKKKSILNKAIKELLYIFSSTLLHIDRWEKVRLQEI